MQLRKKEVILDATGARKIVVSEAGWDYTFRFDATDKEIQQKLRDPNHNDVFKFFCTNYYSLIASCAEGEVPTAEEAFALPRLYLDNWYLTVWELNEEIIGSPCIKELESEKVTFKDGEYLYVFRSSGLPSFVLKMVELETYAVQHPVENDPQGQMFCSIFYPKMAGACNGSVVPNALTVRNWPRSEIAKWLDASRRLNPEWYAVSEETQKEKVSQTKKKARKRSAG
jgi:hypothetical protein